MSHDQERRARALEIYRQMGWGENEVVKEIDGELWKLITDVTFGEIWSRPGLSLRDREMVTLAALVRMKLTSYRDKDRTHLRDLIEVGLLDASWGPQLPAELRSRLQSLLDTPEG